MSFDKMSRSPQYVLAVYIFLLTLPKVGSKLFRIIATPYRGASGWDWFYDQLLVMVCYKSTRNNVSPRAALPPKKTDPIREMRFCSEFLMASTRPLTASRNAIMSGGYFPILSVSVYIARFFPSTNGWCYWIVFQVNFRLRKIKKLVKQNEWRRFYLFWNNSIHN